MRTLDRNKTSVWYVTPSQEVELKDDDGYYTGEIGFEFGTPIETRLSLYPANSEIKEQLFGTDASVDMVSVSNEVVLEEDTLIFLSEPIGDYDRTYDYKVSSIMKSLNTYNYGLKGRM